MADIVAKQPSEIRRGISTVGDGQNSFKHLRGVGAFSGTAASGTLLVPGFTKIAHVQLTALNAPKTLTKSIFLTLGSIIATAAHTCTVPAAGTVTAGIFATKDPITPGNDVDFWRFGIQNKGQAGVGSAWVVDPTVAGSGTQLTGGFAIAAYTGKALPLGIAGALDVVANDVLEVSFTKNGSAGNMTESSLRIDVNVGGTDETLYVTANSDGTIPISAGKITINRTGNLKTADLKFSFTVTGT